LNFPTLRWRSLVNSFKPLTVYKGFVVPEEYAAGAMDAFDAVTYLQQIGLKKEAEQFFVTLKNIRVPTGFIVTNKESNNVYDQGEDIPVTFAEGRKVNNWDDFMAYAQDEPQWDIQETGVDSVEEQETTLTDEDLNTYYEQLKENTRELLQKNGFEETKEYLEELKKQAENEQQAQKIQTVINAVEAFETAAAKNEAGVDEIPLAEREDLEELVEKYDYVGKNGLPLLYNAEVRGDKVKLNHAVKVGVDIGLIFSALDYFGFDTELERLKSELNIEDYNKTDETPGSNPKSKPSVNFSDLTAFLGENPDIKEIMHLFSVTSDFVLGKDYYFDAVENYSTAKNQKNRDLPPKDSPGFVTVIEQYKDKTPEDIKFLRMSMLDKIVSTAEILSRPDIGTQFDQQIRSAEEKALVETETADEKSIREDSGQKISGSYVHLYYRNGLHFWQALKSRLGERNAFKLLEEHFELRQVDTKRVRELGYEIKRNELENMLLSGWYLAPKDKSVANSSEFAKTVHDTIKIQNNDFKNVISNYTYLYHQHHYNVEEEHPETFNGEDALELGFSLTKDENPLLRLVSGDARDKLNQVVADLPNAMRFLPYKNNKLDFSYQKRIQLLRDAGVDAGPEIFDDVEGNADNIMKVLQHLYNTNYKEEHHVVLRYQMQRLLPRTTAPADVFVGQKKVLKHGSSLNVDDVTFEDVDSLPHEFDHHVKIERLQSEIFQDNFSALVDKDNPEGQDEAIDKIVSNVEEQLKTVDSEIKDFIVSYVREQLRAITDKYNEQGAKAGVHFENLTWVPFLVAHAQAGKINNIREIDPKEGEYVDSNYVPTLEDDSKKKTGRAGAGFYGMYGLRWEGKNEDGDDVIYTLGGPSGDATSAIDAFYTEFNPSKNEVTHRHIEAKQLKGSQKEYAHMGSLPKAMGYYLESLHYLQKISESEEPFKVKVKPTYNINMTQDGTHSVENITLEKGNVTDPKTKNTRFAVGGIGKAIKQAAKSLYNAIKNSLRME